MLTLDQTAHHFHVLGPFLGASQRAALGELCRYSDEREFFRDLIAGYAERVRDIPTSYQTDGQGMAAVAYLHYFHGGADWYITEKDRLPEQVQAFGWADLGLGVGELGYLSIEELTAAGVELDLYWTPKPLGECIKGRV